MAGIKKKNLMQAGLILLTLYFLVEGLNHVMDWGNRAKAFNIKTYNLETYLYNNGLLFYRFHSHFFKYFSDQIVLIYGVMTLFCGIGMLFFDEKKKRNIFL